MAFYRSLQKTIQLILQLYMVFTVFAGWVLALDMQYISVVPQVITDPSLSRFDLFGNGIGAPMFIIHLSTIGEETTYDNLQIHYLATLQYRDDGTDRTRTIYEGMSNVFSMAANESVMIPSTEFLKDRNPNVRASLAYTLYELDDIALKERMQTSQRIPDGILSFSIRLLQNGAPIEQQDYSHEIMNALSIDLVAPGNELGSEIGELYNPKPLFAWTSQLYPGIYGDEEVFELRIYEARPGETGSEALQRLPIFSTKVNAYQFTYPSDGRQLVPGYSYYWEVVGIIKGSATAGIRSPVYGFKLMPVNNPDVLEVLAILRIILDQAVIDKVDGYVSGVTVRINDTQVGTEQLRETVLKIQAGEFSLIQALVR